MIWGSILSTLGGGLLGQVQGFVSKTQDNKNKIDIEKIRSAERIELAKLDANKSKTDLQIQQSKTEEVVASSQADIETERFDAIKNIAKDSKRDGFLADLTYFIVSTLRPISTYILLFVVAFTALKAPQDIEYIAPVLYLLDIMIGFWFVRRSFEKGIDQHFFAKSKKKS